MSKVINELRAKIDGIDEKILSLLDKRAQIARKIGKEKKNDDSSEIPIYDPIREKKVLDRLEKLASKKDPLKNFPKHLVSPVFREIISASRSLQDKSKVAFLGSVGTFTHLAANKHFGRSAEFVECATIQSVFETVERGDAEYGVVPLENSYEGSVTQTLHNLYRTPLKIIGELELEINHALLGHHNDLKKIKRLYSHPQALGQTHVWLTDHIPNATLIESPSTVHAAEHASKRKDAAAIANPLVADLYGLMILRKKIQDSELNETRFVVLSKKPFQTSTEGDSLKQTSIIFETADEKGALAKILKLFDEAGVNLSRIESRRSSTQKGCYMFFAELGGHSNDPEISSVLKKIETVCKSLKLLGSYPVKIK